MNHDQPGRGTTRKSWVRTAALGMLVAAPMAVLASPAYAATAVSKSGDQLIATAAAGKINDLFIRASPNGQFILIRDRGDTLTPGSGCQAVGTEVQCPGSGTSRIVVNAGDGNDTVNVVNTSRTNALNGQAGNDNLSASGAGSGRNLLSGGSGDDRLFGNDIFDALSGGAGNDLLVGGAFLRGGDGNDDLRGGDGNDELRGDAGNDRLDGGNGFDDLCIGEIEINCEADV